MTDTQDAPILVSRDGPVMTITLNNPDKLNAFVPEVEAQFLQLIEDLPHDVANTRVVIITGAGRAFCAGGDVVRNLHHHAHPEMMTGTLAAAKRLVNAFLDAPQPIIANVNGDAVGLGATVALLCDLVFMNETGRIGDPHVKVGLTCGDGAALLWPQLIGYARAKQYLFSGDLMTGTEAAAIGLVNSAVPIDELGALVDRWAKRLSTSAPLALRGTKAAMNAGLKAIANQVLDTGLYHEEMNFRSDDLLEATNAFIDRRKPVFTGR